MDITIADQDSDTIYVTNQKDIVKHAEYCMKQYPTVVNEIPKEKNIYNSSLKSFAIIDNGLAASQTDIGESSNLAQVAQSYSYTIDDDDRIQGYVCILAVLAQIAIDSAKRKFSVSVSEEIKRIKEDLDVKNVGYPAFWLAIRKCFPRKMINPAIRCPMNKIYNLKLDSYNPDDSTIPFSDLFVGNQLDKEKSSRRVARTVEKMIQKYSWDLSQYNIDDDTNENKEDYLCLRSDFEEMVEDIRKSNMSKRYSVVMSWLISRAFKTTKQANNSVNKTKLNKNRALLLKTLYEVNNEAFLQCFKDPLKIF